jgi:hypothetical protein
VQIRWILIKQLVHIVTTGFKGLNREKWFKPTLSFWHLPHFCGHFFRTTLGCVPADASTHFTYSVKGSQDVETHRQHWGSRNNCVLVGCWFDTRRCRHLSSVPTWSVESTHPGLGGDSFGSAGHWCMCNLQLSGCECPGAGSTTPEIMMSCQGNCKHCNWRQHRTLGKENILKVFENRVFRGIFGC